MEENLSKIGQLKGKIFENLSWEFIRKVRKPIDLTKFDEVRWFLGAYSTLFPRFTIKGGRLFEKEKKILRELLFSSIKELKEFSPRDYDKWFYTLIEKIIKKVPKLTFGHAQKLINILMKYHFVYFNTTRDGEWIKKNSWLANYFDYFHAPIDSKVLKNLRQKYSFALPFYKRRWTLWDKEDESLYREIQALIRKVVEGSGGKYFNALHLEMEELWKDWREDKEAKDTLKNFIEEIIDEVNKEFPGEFSLNETVNYFSIQRTGYKKYKNVVCFAKHERVLSINKYANISKTLFQLPPFSKLKRVAFPPQDLQLRREN
ncbi:hypothetical protein J7K43_09060, partial [Candidatus Calescamantes bacterium]|nr:hypothetical protein [Candidatus Calescamantes bacterium]